MATQQAINLAHAFIVLASAVLLSAVVLRFSRDGDEIHSRHVAALRRRLDEASK